MVRKEHGEVTSWLLQGKVRLQDDEVATLLHVLVYKILKMQKCEVNLRNFLT